jgi:hypothetical protein
VLASIRVEVEGGRVSYVTTPAIRNDGNVIAYLALVRVALRRIKRIAHCDITRPGDTSIGAKGVKKLRIAIVGRVSSVVPNSIQPPIRSHGECPEPMPLALVVGIVIDSNRSAEGCAAVSAAGEHHFRETLPGRLHAREHVNVVVSRPTGVVNRQETLPS